MRRKSNAKVFAAIAAVSGLISGQMVRAGTSGTWNPTGFAGANGSGLWSLPADWTGGIVADGQDGIANFSTLDITADTTVHLDTARTIGQLIFGDITPSNNWFLDNNGNASNILTLSTSTGTPTITINTATTATISATLAGTQGFTLAAGTGALDLTGANTYSGNTTIASGILNINGDAALGASTNGIVFSGASGTLQAGAAMINLNASRNISLTSATAGSTVTFQTGANYLAINGNITSGVGAAPVILTKSAAGSTVNATTDSGILVLSGNNSFAAGSSFQFTGNTVTDDGILRLASSNALGSNAFTIDDWTQNVGNATASITELSGGITIGSNVSLLARSKNSDDPLLRNISGNNTFGGTVSIVASGGLGDIESADPNGTLTLSGTINTATTTLGAAPTDRTFLLYGNGNTVLSGTIANGTGSIGRLIMGGSHGSTWTFTNAQTFTGTTVDGLFVNGGTTVLDFSQWGSATNMFPASTNLSAVGGNLTIKGLASGTTSQAFAGTFTIGTTGNGNAAGGSTITINPNGGSGTTLTLPNAWTRNVAGTVNFDLSAGTGGSPASVVLATPANPVTGTGGLINGIFGYASVKDSTGVGFATNSGGSIVRYTGATPLLTSGNTASTNYSLAIAGATQTQSAGGFSVNSLSIDSTGGGILDLGAGTMTMTSLGLLMSGAGNFTIQNGQVGATASEVILQQYGTGTLTINGTVSSGAGSLTKSGPGTLVLGSTNSYTGATTLDGGVLAVSADNLGGSSSPITFAGGTLKATGTMTLASTHTSTLEAAGGSFDVVSGATLTYGGVIAGTSTGLIGNTGTTPTSLTKLDSGTLNLTGTANTYSGGTFINAGTLAIAGDGSLGAAIVGGAPAPGTPDINIIFAGTSTLQANASTVSLSGNRTVLVDSGVTATLDPQANSFTVAGAITSQSSSGALVIGTVGGSSIGSVALTSAISSYTVPTTINSGTLSVSFLTNGGSLSSLGQSNNAASNLIFAGGGLSYTGATTSTDRNFTINPGSTATIGVTNAATTLSMSGTTPATTGGLTKTGLGTLKLTGSHVYTGATTIIGGMLLLNGSLSSSSAVAVNNTGMLAGTGNAAGAVTVASGGGLSPGDPATNSGVGTLSAGSLSLANGSLFNVDFGSGNDAINVAGGGGLTINGGSLSLLVAGTSTPFSTDGTYTLINFNGALTGSGNNFTIANSQPGKAYSFANSTATAIKLTITDSSSSFWNGSQSDELWTDSGNWDANSIPNSQGVTATFVTPNSFTRTDGVVQLNGNKTVGALVFNNALSFDLIGTAANHTGSTLTIDNAAATAAINVGAGTQTIETPITLNSNMQVTTAASTSLTMSGAITGATKTITASGSGTLVLSGTNTYNNTTVTGGTLQIGSGGSTGTLGSSDVTLASGTNLVFNRNNAYAVANNILGSGSAVTQNGSGTLTLSGNDTFGSTTTGLTMNSGGVTLGSASAFPSGAALAVNNGTLDLKGNGITIGSLTGGTAATPGNGVITDSTAGSGTTTLTLNYGGASIDYYGEINNGPNGQKLAFVKNGVGGNGGAITMRSPSTFSGGSTINAGDVDLYSSTSLGTGPITVANTAGNTRLRLNNGVNIANQIIINAANPGTGFGAIQTINATDTVTVSGEVDINANSTSGGHFIGPTTSGLLSINGPIIMGGTATFVNVRAGIVQFGQNTTPASNYSALTISTSGFSVGAANGIATNAVVSLGTSAAAAIDLNGWDQTLAGIIQSGNTGSITSSFGTLTNPGPSDGPNFTSILTVNTSATAFPDATPDTYAGTLTGGLSVVKDGAGTLLLSNSGSSYGAQVDGPTTIINGVLGAAVLANGGAVSSIGESSSDPSNLVFGGTGSSATLTSGTLRYTGPTASTDHNFTITNGTIATWDVSTAGANLTLNGAPASGSAGGFNKAGLGTLTLASSAAYDYHGATSVTAGTLLVNNTVSNSSSVTIASGAVLGGTGSIAGALNHTAGIITGNDVGTVGTLTLTGPLTMNGGTARFDVNSSATPTGDLIQVNNNFTFGATPSTIDLEFLNNTSTLPTSFTYKLFGVTGTISGTQNFDAHYITNIGHATFTTVTLAHEIDVNVNITAGASNLNWNSTSSGAWDVNTSSNWFNSANNAQTVFFQGDNVNFIDGAGLQTAIVLNTSVQPGSTVVNSSTNNYSITGTGGINGPGPLTKSGLSTLTLATTNGYLGGTNINGGIVALASAGALSTSGTISFGGGTLQYSASNTTDYSSQFSNAANQAYSVDTNGQNITWAGNLTSTGGTLTKAGAGTLTLTGSNSYSGNTTINAGTLSIAAATNIGAGNLVFNGGTLATGGPTLGNNVVVNSGGGTLANTGNLTINGTLTGTGTLNSSGTAVIFNGTQANFSGTLISNHQINFIDLSPTAAYVANAAGTNDFIYGGTTPPAGPLQMGSLSGTVASATVRNGNTAAVGPITFQIGALNTSTTFAGIIANNTTGDVTPADDIAGVTKVGTGTLTLSGVNTYTGATQINTGTLALASTGSLASPSIVVNASAIANFNGQLTGTPNVTANGSITLGVNDGSNGAAGAILVRKWGTLNVAASTGNVTLTATTAANHAQRQLLVLTSASANPLSNSGKIDLSNNDMIIQQGNTGSVSTAGSVANQLKTAFNAGSGYWNGTTGIGSSTAAGDSRFLTTLGYRTGGGTATPFDGQTTTATDVLVKYTYYGDANLDGVVNGADYQQIDLGFGSGATGWSNGDFNYDGVVNGSDFALIDNTFNQLTATGASPLAVIAGSAAVTSTVPEPTTLGLLGIGAIGLLGRRHRRSRM